ncbi:retron St85 family RNA-directed DNA polymerase [Minwuia sp.]|uniref:retron St85 family RNA-directed DNA polymerase n=1 Tax=Minwuia sp. TaxID=2493630 RepID=UPI003A953B0D
MPTRTYYFPNNLTHLEEILEAEGIQIPTQKILHFRNVNAAPLLEPETISIFLGVSPKLIYSIIRKIDVHYRTFHLLKKNGNFRKIDAPRTYLKVIQWWILDNILVRQSVRPEVFGFVPKRSAVMNAEYHRGAKRILNVDIKDFFPSISQIKVNNVFRNIGYSEEVSEVLAKLCCLDSKLPQGAPTSPAIANLVMWEIDQKLQLLSEEQGICYSRYADDLSFSSQQWISQAFFEDVASIIKDEGFELNANKSRFAGLGQQMEVTGVVINKVHQPPRKWRKRVRASLHRLEHQDRLTRRDLRYLNGIAAMGMQYPESVQLQKLSQQAISLSCQKRETVVGFGARPRLPMNLTIRQAETLAALRIWRGDNGERLHRFAGDNGNDYLLARAMRKIDAKNVDEAYKWAEEHL